MQKIYYFLLVLNCSLIAYQDFSKRLVHIFLLVSLFVISILINLKLTLLGIETIFINLTFVLINILGLIFFFSFKKGKLANPINKNIGAGDVIFFVSITPLFSLNRYVLFFIGSMLLSLVIHIVFFKKKVSIPLAGYMALFLITVFSLEMFLKTSFFFYEFK